MQPQNATAERTMARLARASHGVVTRADLQRAGVTPEEIKQRLGRGALLRVHRGVFRVGHAAPSIEARYLAAVRACGEGALLSGRAAAHLLSLLKRPPAQPEVASTARRHIPGVTTRRARHMHPAEATIWRGIPTTTPARTLVDWLLFWTLLSWRAPATRRASGTARHPATSRRCCRGAPTAPAPRSCAGSCAATCA